ncbi:CsxC family protein [Haloimpatiens sp. FM7315]|uniref:CsxC family protein n=1 Tax=Haloimpatiens sp. FM7315 TaxID=3298609 RepID=UPI0035A2B613
MPICNSTVDPKTLCLCNNTQITPQGTNGPLVAKIPVVLAETEIQIDTEAEITFPEPYAEIKRITKDVYLTQCKLIPGTGTSEDGVPTSGKLFIAGYIRKNIQYATTECVSSSIVGGVIKDLTVDVNFQGVTEIIYSRAPIFEYAPNEDEIDFTCTPCNCSCSDVTLGKIPCEQVYRHRVIFNEKPFCELISSRIYEYDTHTNPTVVSQNFPDRVVYNSLTEKMVVYITLKVLQLQQVNID